MSAFVIQMARYTFFINPKTATNQIIEIFTQRYPQLLQVDENYLYLLARLLILI